MKSFVIVVDMQQDFVAANGALPVVDAERLVAPMQKWLASLDPEEVAGVLFTKDTHIPAIYARSEEAAQLPPHCVHGTPGWALVVDPVALDLAIPHYVLEKGVFDMWAEPDIIIERMDRPDSAPRDAFFEQLRASGVREITVVGVAADYCVRWAIEGLIQRGFHVTVPGHLTRGIARQIDTVAVEEWAGAEVAIG